jgi:carbon-monoxide dehydrogenase large subunit
MALERFTGRREDRRLLTGQGRYTADWSLPGQLYGYFLRSDHAHAQIVSLNTSEAQKSFSVVGVFIGEDMKHYKTPPPQVKYPIKVPRRDILARERVHYVGQEIALVVASSPAAAQDAAEKIEIEFEDLPAVVDAAQALAAGAPLLHEDVPGNLAATYEYGDEKRAAEALAGAAHVTRLELESTRVSGTPMEPKACVAAYDAASDSYDVFASSQGLWEMLPNFVAITACRPSASGSTRATSAAASASARRLIPSTSR